MNLQNGTQLGPYEVIGPLGAGGMGEVYKARDKKLQREVALKILPGHVATNRDSLSRFEREAVVLAQLSHPNILAIHDFGKYDGVTLAATELLEGETLRHRMERGTLPARRALEIAAAIADGLAAAHSKGVVHRDLKPENVFLTVDDQVKILDFGLARVDLQQAAERRHEGSLPTETDPSIVKGTIGYMSPEQLRGHVVDARSDLFSLGCVLYEMLSGERPFARDTIADSMTAILKEEPDDILDSGRPVPVGAERVVAHCLEKDPKKRFQSAKDLALHLKTLVSSGEINSSFLPVFRSRNRVRFWAPVLLFVALLVAGSSYLWMWDAFPGEVESFRPSVAVLYFENDSGDESLDWLRNALANMLVTDLSQSPHIEVLSTDRLHQILSDLDQLESRSIDYEVIQDLARLGGVRTVVRGSFVKAGTAFRLNILLQEAESGRILATERVEGEGEEAIFEMVDEITNRIKSKLEVRAVADKSLDRGIEEVTTSSVEALRHYVEGNGYHYQSKEAEAVKELEKAVELDPDFAMALAKLSVSHWNLGHFKESFDYAELALEHVDRLPARERYYIEGRFYSLKPETYDRAIAAYERAIGLYPDHSAARHNLALVYHSMERFDDAIAQGEELIRRGTDFAPSHSNLALSYAAAGRYEEGLEILERYIKSQPESAIAHRILGNYYLEGQRLNEAVAAFDRSEVLAPGNLDIKRGRFLIYLLQQDWAAAGVQVTEVLSSSNPYWTREGLMMKSLLGLYRGNVETTLQALDEATGTFPETGPLLAGILANKAKVLMEVDRPQAALQIATRALESSRGYPVEGEVLSLLALAHAHLGRREQAEATCERWRRTFRSLPPGVIERVDSMLSGCFALAEGDASEAIRHLQKARSVMPIRGVKGWEKTRVRYSLAAAYWLNEERDQAAEWFRKVVESGNERLSEPISFVRSLYFLGRYHREEGQLDEASHFFERFLEYWGEGQLDRDRVREAEEFLQGFVLRDS